MKRISFFFLFALAFLQLRCQEDKPTVQQREKGTPENFYFGADLSYVNQIVDKGGVYRDGEPVSPYHLFASRGTNLIRLRLWHTPTWTKEVYEPDGETMYNDLLDVEKAIGLARAEGMEVLLDFHYSDNWADPGKQEIPAAWEGITSEEALIDSVFEYTFNVLTYLEARNLMPDLVQLGNEINCGMLYANAPAEFPSCNVCGDNAQWTRLGKVINTAIDAVNAVKKSSSVDTKIILHVADPKNVEWWFDNITSTGGVSGFDMVGFSYYPLWHTMITPNALSQSIATFRTKYERPVLILETAYPWTMEAKDNYNNLFGSDTPIDGFPFTKEGQLNMLIKLTQEVIDGGGSGIIYWEPAWLSVPGLKDQWGEGSSWENNTFFDFEGNATESFDFIKHEYELKQ